MKYAFRALIVCCFLTATSSAFAGEWIELFDGKSLDGWKPYKGEKIGESWVIDNGTLHLTQRGGGSIVTDRTFGDFELEFEWKISEGGNSGVMYRVRLGDKAPHMSGPEYQLLDDSRHRDGKSPANASGALYAMIAPKGKKLNAVGEWNSARIKLHDNNLEHWVNGVKVVETTMGDANWDKMIQDSKFKQWPQFSKSASGHICLQDHGDKVWFRKLRIRELN